MDSPSSPAQTPSPQTSHATPEPTHVASKNRHTKQLVGLGALLFLVIGLGVGTVLVQHNQDIRNRAFTGFSVTSENQTVSQTDVLRYAAPETIPQHDAWIDTKSARGLFYTYAKQFKNSSPEYQEISVPQLSVHGQVFFKYDATTDTSYVFTRFTNLQSVKGKLLELWMPSAFDTSNFYLGTAQFVLEDSYPAAYVISVSNGNLKSEGTSFIFSYDGTSARTNHRPDQSFVVVKF